MIVPEILILLILIGAAFVFLMIFNIKMAVVAFLVTLPFQSIFFWIKFMFISLSDVFAVLIFFSWLIQLILGRVELPRKKALYFISVMWVLILIGCFTSIDQRTALRFAFRLLSFYAIFVVLLSVMNNMRMVRLVLYALVVQLVIISVVTNWKYVRSDVTIKEITDVDEEFEHSGIRKSGIAESMNATAFNLTILMPLTLGLALMEKMKKLIPVLVVSLSALFITMSRSGWVAFGASIFFLPKLKLKQILLLVILFAVIFSLFYTIFFGRIISSTLESVSITTRLLMYDFSFYVFKHYPILGIGGGNFTVNAYRVFPELRYRLPARSAYCSTHNQYLAVMVENGIIALLIYLFFLAYTAMYALKKTELKDEKITILRRSVLASFVALLVFQMFAEYGLRNYLSWTLIALVYCLYDITVRQHLREKALAAHQSDAVGKAECDEGVQLEISTPGNMPNNVRIMDIHQDDTKNG